MTATVEQMVEHPMLVKVPPAVELTARQVEILTLIASGKGSKEIASDLRISESTVGVHRVMLYRAIGVHDMITLTLYAVREGYVKVV
jgi:DNA-binding NarL/FixJ family response regulator